MKTITITENEVGQKFELGPYEIFHFAPDAPYAEIVCQDGTVIDPHGRNPKHSILPTPIDFVAEGFGKTFQTYTIRKYSSPDEKDPKPIGEFSVQLRQK